MRFEPEALHGANAGLNIARNLMEKVKAEFPWISYGDLWTLAGVAAVQVSLVLAGLTLELTSLCAGNVRTQDSLETRSH